MEPPFSNALSSVARVERRWVSDDVALVSSPLPAAETWSQTKVETAAGESPVVSVWTKWESNTKSPNANNGLAAPGS